MSFVRSYYDELNRQFLVDYVYGNPRLEAAIVHVLRSTPRSTRSVLDVGCGIGWSSHEIVRHLPDVTVAGVDLSGAAVQTADALFGSPRLEFSLQDVTDESWGLPAAYDLIVMCDVYEHIPKARRRRFNIALDRLLSRGGRIVLTFPSAAHQEFLARHHPERLQPFDETITETTLQELAEAVGGVVDQFRPVDVWAPADYIHAVIARPDSPAVVDSPQVRLEPPRERADRVRSRLRRRVTPDGLLLPDRSGRAVLVVSPLRGGYSETFIRAQMEGLPSRVEVLFGHWPQFETETGGPVMPRWVRRVRRVVRIASRGRGSEARLDLLWLAWYLRRRRVQIVLAQYGPTGAAWVRACKLLSLPLVTHFHGFDAYDEAVLQQQREAYKGLFAAGDAFVAVSRDMERQLVALGAPRMRVHYIPSGVDAERFRGARPASAPPRFISVGRFVEKKGQLLTLLAFRRLLDGAPDARLSLVGDGPLLDVCQQLASALDMSHAVEFAGVRTPNEIAEMFREARAYVQHSVRAPNGDSEGTPVAVLEAAVSGLPVIATRHGGIPDAIEDGASGYLVAEGDFERMAACMLQLARDPELAGAMGRRAREQVTAEFGQPKNLATLWELLVAVMNRRDGS